MTGAFAKINLLLKIRNVLQIAKHFGGDTFIGYSLIEAVDKRPADEILKTIQDCERDNPVMINKLIGEDLVKQVSDIKIT